MGNWGSVQLGTSPRGVRVQGIYPPTPESLVEGCSRTGGSINSMAFLTVPCTGLPGLSRQRKPSSKELWVLATESQRGGDELKDMGWPGSASTKVQILLERAFELSFNQRHLVKIYITANSEKG